MDNLNYTTPTVDEQWASSRETTSPAVAAAIHAIADDTRTPDQIWESPTQAEWDHVLMAVGQYRDAGLYDTYSSEVLYQWGEEQIILAPNPD